MSLPITPCPGCGQPPTGPEFCNVWQVGHSATPFKLAATVICKRCLIMAHGRTKPQARERWNLAARAVIDGTKRVESQAPSSSPREER